MDDFDLIAYTSEGLSWRDIFLAEFSDVIFYFENAEYEPFYEKLLSIIVPSLLSGKISCEGGKTMVLKKARSKNDIGVPRVFVLDKDFDDILNSMENLDGVIYLKSYCLENYLISPAAVLDYIIDEFRLRVTEAHKSTEDFPDFFSSLVNRYEILARHFLVARKNRIKSMKTTKIPAADMISGDGIGDILSLEWIQDYKMKLFAEAAQDLKTEWIEASTIENLLVHAFDYEHGDTPADDTISRHYSGKQIFGLVLKYFEITLQVNLAEKSRISMYMSLLSRMKDIPERLEYLTSAINRTVSAQRQVLCA